ncbi:hypothetical protein [Natronolimnohabitans innermongolicus]|uniref:Uncharacterized protein n=1 Tax=Natronolimnohabitans innermongolicus JCM 12255 TaxID=1227499 RepID=L9WID8_9EURY|nr:hypothetical protein [Natronolimnohabitans innermongolicus]ELY49214.1 hypothetical protein C493_20997 [Natronolimnohabitans innermongolicus JCM 12255]
MSSEDDSGGVSVPLPGDVTDWLEDDAGRPDESREESCRRLIRAAHAVATTDGIEPRDLEDLEDVASLQAELDAQREEFTELLEDVRRRVIQVKRETDAKAPADHDHEAYAASDALDGVAADLAALRDDHAALASTVDDGFDNVETVLEDVLAETETLDERTTTLASVLVDLRERRTDADRRERHREAADELKLAANRLGIRTADCDECDETVDLALLTAPACPHCATQITDLEKRQGFFGSDTLVTGAPPALEGAVDDGSDEERGTDVDAADEDGVETVTTDDDVTAASTAVGTDADRPETGFEFNRERSVR